MVIIIPKSAALVLQVHEGTARKKLRELKRHYNQKPHEKVCITKFCEYFGLNEQRVTKELNSMGWY